MTNLDILKVILRRVWVEGDMSAIDEYFAPDAGAHGLVPDMTLTHEDHKTMCQAILSMVGSPEITTVKTLQDADWVAVMVRIRAQSSIGTGPLSASGQIMARFENKRIVEAYNHFDLLSLFQQLGLIPHEAITLCLSGQRLD